MNLTDTKKALKAASKTIETLQDAYHERESDYNDELIQISERYEAMRVALIEEVEELKNTVEAQKGALNRNRARAQQLDTRIGIAMQALVFIAAGHGELRGNEGRTQLYAAEQLAIIGSTPISVAE